jgi:hypothetical protein
MAEYRLGEKEVVGAFFVRFYSEFTARNQIFCWLCGECDADTILVSVGLILTEKVKAGLRLRRYTVWICYIIKEEMGRFLSRGAWHVLWPDLGLPTHERILQLRCCRPSTRSLPTYASWLPASHPHTVAVASESMHHRKQQSWRWNIPNGIHAQVPAGPVEL